jgi:hypothetical protein
MNAVSSKTSSARFATFFLLAVVLLAGCTFNAPDGPPFEALPGPSDQEALVYVYRPPNEEWGYDRTYYLFDAKEKLTDLLHGGYFPFVVKPGKVTLLADVNRSFRTWLAGGVIELAAAAEGAVMDFHANAGETYYVRFHPIAHAWHFEPTMTLVSKNEGLSQLRSCKLLSKHVPD